MKEKLLTGFVVILFIANITPLVNAASGEVESGNTGSDSQNPLPDYTVFEPPYNGTRTITSYLGNPWAGTNLSTGGVATCADTTEEIDDVSCSASAFQRLDISVGRPKELTVDFTIDDYIMGNKGVGWADETGWDIVWRFKEFDAAHEGYETVASITHYDPNVFNPIDDIISWLIGVGLANAGLKYTVPTLSILLRILDFADLADAPQYLMFDDLNFSFMVSEGINSIWVGLRSWTDGSNFICWNHGKIRKIIVHGIAPPAIPTIEAVDNPRDTDTDYTFQVVTVDTNNDPVKYEIDWGDGNITTTGYNKTGEPAVEVTHSYSETGDYNITVKAIDCDGMESDWSDSLPVHIVNHRPKITSLYVCWPDENGVDIPKDKVRRYLNYYYKIQSWDADIDTQTIKYFMRFSDEGIPHESDNISSLWYGFYHRFNNLGYYTVTTWCEDSVGSQSPKQNFTIHVINTLPYTPSNPSPTTGATIYVSSSINPDSTTVKSDPTQVNLQTAYLDPQASQTTYSLNQDAVQVESADAESSTTTTSASSNIAEPIASTSQELESSSATTGSISGQTALNGIDLRWSGGDPDGDNVTYKIYFGTSSPSSLIGTTENTCSYHYSGTLTAGNTYYWKVVAIDEYGGVAEGPVWHFSVSNDNNNDNNNSSDTQQTNNAVSQPIEEYQTLA